MNLSVQFHVSKLCIYGANTKYYRQRVKDKEETQVYEDFLSGPPAVAPNIFIGFAQWVGSTTNILNFVDTHVILKPFLF